MPAKQDTKVRFVAYTVSVATSGPCEILVFPDENAPFTSPALERGLPEEIAKLGKQHKR